jgi:transcriptional repressor NrdR
MKCPYCTGQRNKVIDSRLNREGESIRRRRECLDCGRRFTTYEKVEDFSLMVIKKDGSREPFDKNKITMGMIKACEKRPISVNVVEDFISELEREFHERGEREVESQEIGERVIKKLYEIDEVAYVRFASVYRSFKDVNQFMDELRDLLKDKERAMDDQKLGIEKGQTSKPALELLKTEDDK